MDYFQVAELYFSFDDKLEMLSERLNFKPFRTEKPEKECNFLFHLDIDTNLRLTNSNNKFTYSNEIGCYGVTCENGNYEWVLKKTNEDRFYVMKLNVITKHALLNFKINDAFTMQAADDFTRFAFIYSAAFHHTVLLHASCIKNDNRGIAFLGRSGIGKSTHSSLWLENIEGSELLNDDQPAVRIKDNKVIIYGTPWSGKTMCYKKEMTMLKAILCMEQKPYNKLIRINKIQLFTHLLSAASLIRTDKITLKEISSTLSKISEIVKGGILQNKANKEAALLAHKFLLNDENEF